jgi:hypothetical protein
MEGFYSLLVAVLGHKVKLLVIYGNFLVARWIRPGRSPLFC